MSSTFPESMSYILEVGASSVWNLTSDEVVSASSSLLTICLLCFEVGKKLQGGHVARRVLAAKAGPSPSWVIPQSGAQSYFSSWQSCSCGRRVAWL